jgi:hypothetical protein
MKTVDKSIDERESLRLYARVLSTTRRVDAAGLWRCGSKACDRPMLSAFTGLGLRLESRTGLRRTGVNRGLQRDGVLNGIR